MGKMIQIDGKKLEKILAERKLKRSVISVEMGMSDALLSHNIIRNQISTSTAKMLEAMYGIMLNDYKYVEPPKPAPEPEQTESPIVEEEPMKAPEVDYGIIRDAVCEGLLDALYQAINDNDMRNAIMGLLTNAHLSALQLNLKKAYANANGKGGAK